MKLEEGEKSRHGAYNRYDEESKTQMVWLYQKTEYKYILCEVVVGLTFQIVRG